MVVQLLAVARDLGVDAVPGGVYLLSADAEPLDGHGEGSERGREGEEFSDADSRPRVDGEDLEPDPSPAQALPAQASTAWRIRGGSSRDTNGPRGRSLMK
jgi:hypothetical protein